MSPVSNAGATPATESGRSPRHDGEASRARLLRSGLQLFAQQGFAKTSTRELAEHAGVNVASISYYFGDKAGLYRAVFFEPLGSPQDDVARYNGSGLSLAQALGGLYAGFLEPLKQGDTARLCMKLHFREMLEPTGLWEEEIAHGIKPMHDALLAVLCRHFGLDQADDELQRLAVCIVGLGVHMHVGHDVVRQLAPQLHDDADALDRWSDRLVMYALAMIDAEQQRRATFGDEGRPA
jgi:TetR/AcrR family transcriptional regulator, regulator of cefoperazone and chloramphenicol sensitivity